MSRKNVYVKQEDEELWRQFKLAVKREGSSISSTVMRLVKRWMVSHSPGNPQTTIQSFSEGGQTTLSNVEGRIRQLCVEYRGDLYYRDLVKWIKERGVDKGRARVAMAERVESWLKARGLVVFR